MTHNFERLVAHILPLSKASTFNLARLEWELRYIEVSDEPDHCPCGHEIREHCYIENVLTHAQTYVGNVCVHQFLGLKTGTLFDGLKRIKADPRANPNHALIDHAEKAGYIYPNEVAFLRSTAFKRKLSEKQLAWKEKINRRILSHTVVGKRTVR